MRCHYTPSRMSKIEKIEHNSKDMGELEPSYTAGREYKMLYPLGEIVWQHL